MVEGIIKAYDFVVIGGGSGGLAAARRAAQFGKNVCLIEKIHLGGTCVNVGCIPKKVIFNAAHIYDSMKLAHYYGIDFTNSKFDWLKLKELRTTKIKKLNTIFESHLEKAGITYIKGQAKFKDKDHVEVVNGEEVVRILIFNINTHLILKLIVFRLWSLRLTFALQLEANLIILDGFQVWSTLLTATSSLKLRNYQKSFSSSGEATLEWKLQMCSQASE
jgi:hypothetical protein